MTGKKSKKIFLRVDHIMGLKKIHHSPFWDISHVLVWYRLQNILEQADLGLFRAIFCRRRGTVQAFVKRARNEVDHM